jgi:hypothetical protein
MGGGFSVCTQLSGTARRQWGELEQGNSVARADGMVDDSWQSPVVPTGTQPRQRLSVQHCPTGRRQVGFDGAAGELVAKPQPEPVGDEHAAPLTFVDGSLRVWSHRQQEIELDVERDDGSRLEHSPGAGRQP